MTSPEREPSATAWKTSPWVWGSLLPLGVILVAIGGYVVVRQEEDWGWDAAKAFAVAIAVLVVGIDLWGRYRRETSGNR